MKKIIVVDDDLGILEVLKIILEQNNFEVEAISNPENLLTKLKKVKPDLLMMDLWMSGYDGSDIARDIRADKKLSKMPLIIISARNDSEVEEAKKLATEFIKKPFEMDELVEKARKLTG